MPRKKSVVTENSEQEALVPDEAGGAEDGPVSYTHLTLPTKRTV